MGLITVAGLGPAGQDLIPAGVLELAAHHRTWLRTRRHPAAAAFPDAESFDSVYDHAADISEVYESIVERLVVAADEGPVAYLVPGSPLVAERTVDLLRSREGLDLRVLPAVSFLDLAWDRLEIDPLATGVRLVDAHDVGRVLATQPGPFLVAQCDSRLALSDVKLAVEDIEDAVPPRVTVLQRLGTDDEAVFEIAWEDLDREVEADHLTSLWIPSLPPTTLDAVDHLHGIVRRLRSECPWDRSQTHQSLVPYVIEEATEVAEAIGALDPEDPSVGQLADLVDELGDLLFQVMLHAAIAEEVGDFRLRDVVEAISAKMLRRHPHVFDRPPGSPEPTPEELAAAWKAAKALEQRERP